MKRLVLASLIGLLLIFQSGVVNHLKAQEEPKNQNTEQKEPTRILKTPEDYEYSSPKKKERQVVRSQGKRSSGEIIELKILAPENHMGKTFQPHPKFWFQTSEKLTVPLRFNLIKNGITIWSGEFIPNSKLFSVQYPKNLPPLSSGVYILGAGVGCPENCHGVRIAFEVEQNETLQKVVRTNIITEEKIKLLAKEGYWFDAQSFIVDVFQEMD
ncbi:MAG: DUF928 domain-containing protein [Crocosphaera sp.]